MLWFLIDRIVECDPGKTLTAIKCFTRSESFFQNHFANYPIVPGVLQIEMIAQAGGKCIKALDSSYAPALGSVKKAKFYKQIYPGDQCEIKFEMEKVTSQYAKGKGIVYVNGEKKSSAEIFYAFLPEEIAKTFDPDVVLEEWKKRELAKKE
jgi:3-hydroxyacyl-[acyl-carrier-protein] dehydratase